MIYMWHCVTCKDCPMRTLNFNTAKLAVHWYLKCERKNKKYLVEN